MAGAAVRAGLGAVTAFLLAAGVFTACSSGPAQDPDAVALCQALDGGMVPGVALGALPQAQTDPVAAMERARGLVRSTCPQHEAAAAAYYKFLEPAPPLPEPVVAPAPAQPTTTTAKSTTTRSRPAATSTRRLPSADEDPSGNLRACMEQTGMTAAGCREASADGLGG